MKNKIIIYKIYLGENKSVNITVNNVNIEGGMY